MGTLFTDILLSVCIPVIQTIAHGASNTKVMCSIPREHRKKNVYLVYYIYRMQYMSSKYANAI